VKSIRRSAALVAFDAAARGLRVVVAVKTALGVSFAIDIVLEGLRAVVAAESTFASFSHAALVPSHRCCRYFLVFNTAAEKSLQSTALNLGPQICVSSPSMLWPLRRAPRLVEALSTTVAVSLGGVSPACQGR